jgi:YVTN family beta-propeller protein
MTRNDQAITGRPEQEILDMTLIPTRLRAGTRVALLTAAALALGTTTAAAATPVRGALHAETSAAEATAYVVNTGSHTLSEIDTASGAVTGTVSLEGRQGIGTTITEQVATPDGKQVWVVDGNRGISVIDAATDKGVALFHPCRGLHGSLLFTPDGTKAYAVCRDGNNWSPVEIDTRTHVSTLLSDVGAHALAISPDGSELYAANGYGVSVIDTATETVTTTIATAGELPTSLLVSPDGAKVYAVFGNDVAVIDTATGTLATTITVGAASPGGITALALSPNGDSIYATGAVDVGSSGSTAQAVSVIDTATDTVTTIPYRGKVVYADSVVFSPNGKLAYVTVEYTYGNHKDACQIEVIHTATEKVAAVIAPGSTAELSPTFVDNGARAYVGPLKDASGQAVTDVVDTATNQDIATIPAAAAVGRTVTADQGRRAYLGTGIYEWVVDTATSQVLTTIEPRWFPGGIVLTPDGSKAFVVGNAAVLAVDTATNAVTEIPMSRGPHEIALSPDGSEAYVTDYFDNTVQIIDTATDTVTGSFVVPVANPAAVYPLGSMAFSPDGGTLYITNFGNISVVDTATDTVTATIPVGPAGANLGELVSSPDGSKLYVSDGPKVLVVDTATDAVATTITLSGTGYSGNGAMALTPDGTQLYAVGYTGTSDALSAIDTATDTVTATITTPVAAAVAVSPDGTQAYLTNGSLNTVSVIDTATNTVSGTIDSSRYPSGVVIGP